MQKLKNFPQISALINRHKDLPEALSSFFAKEVTKKLKERAKSGETVDKEDIFLAMDERVRLYKSRQIRPLINATGIALHTNLGRALISKKTWQELEPLMTSHVNLEFDCDNISRGSRFSCLEDDLKALFNSPGFAVNNNASAVFLILHTLCDTVLTSRSELVEIGGSFRMPEVIKASGVELIELGTSNKTHLKDYQAALEQIPKDKRVIILKTHRSNFIQQGFVSEVDVFTLQALAQKAGATFYYDLGAGFVDNFGSETSIKELAAKGLDLLSFSADKLFASTQAGIILGQNTLIESLKKAQIARMLRLDKIALALLSKALKAHMQKDYKALPSLALLLSSPEEIKEKALELKELCGFGQVVESKAPTGAGSLPGLLLKSYSLAFSKDIKPLQKAFLEKGVLGRVHKDMFLLDLRAVLPNELEALAKIICEVLK